MALPACKLLIRATFFLCSSIIFYILSFSLIFSLTSSFCIPFGSDYAESKRFCSSCMNVGVISPMNPIKSEFVYMELTSQRDLHHFWVELLVNICHTVIKLPLGIHTDYFIFHPHQFWDSFLNPLFYDVDLDLYIREKLIHRIS